MGVNAGEPGALRAGARNSVPVGGLASPNGSTAPANGNGGSNGHGPSKSEVQRRYRRLLIEAHPDHGGERLDAAQRIADLTEARKILLG